MKYLKQFLKAVGTMLLVVALGYLFGVGIVSAWRTYQPEVHVIVLPGRTA